MVDVSTKKLSVVNIILYKYCDTLIPMACFVICTHLLLSSADFFWEQVPMRMKVTAASSVVLNADF